MKLIVSLLSIGVAGALVASDNKIDKPVKYPDLQASLATVTAAVNAMNESFAKPQLSVTPASGQSSIGSSSAQTVVVKQPNTGNSVDINLLNSLLAKVNWNQNANKSMLVTSSTVTAMATTTTSASSPTKLVITPASSASVDVKTDQK